MQVVGQNVFRKCVAGQISYGRFLHSTTEPSRRPAGQSLFGVDSWGRRLLIGFGVGSLLGGVYTAFKYYSTAHGTVSYAQPDIQINRYHLNNVPQLPASRSIKYAGDKTGLKLTLYQYQTCPFCCKVRTLLDYAGLSYDVVEVNPVLRTQLKWSEKYKKVPILIVETPEGEILQLNDSTMIISILYSFLLKTTSSHDHDKDNESLSSITQYYPTRVSVSKDGVQETDILNKYFLMLGDSASAAAATEGKSKSEMNEERKWRQWTDSVYVHTLSPNIYRTMAESLDSFRYFDQVGEWDKNFSSWERTLVIYVGATAMWLIGKRLQKRYHLKQDVRQSLYEESNHWMKTIETKGAGDFMGGHKPNLADLAVYGVLSSIEGCAAFKDLDEHSSIVSDWYTKVKERLQQRQQQSNTLI